MLQRNSDPIQASGCHIEERGGRIEIDPSPDLRVHVLRDARGAVLGDVYGMILQDLPGAGFCVTGDVITIEAEIADPEAFEDKALRRLAGSFAVVTHTTLPRRFYPDAGTTVPLVYCPDLRRAGPSASVILDDIEYGERFLAARHERLVLRRASADRWIPGGLTAHEGVSRLMANHYLDLESWEAVRFWPRRGFALGGNRHDAAAIVAGRMRDIVCATAAAWPNAGLTLTAGFDSRLVLAAARPVAEQLDIFTLSGGDDGVDQVLSGEICRHLGLKHRLHRITTATEAEGEAWDRAVGHVIGHVNREIHPSMRNLDCDLLITGVLGETGRCRFYQGEGAAINDGPVSPSFLLARTGLPQDPDLLADAEKWLAGLSGLPSSVILDLVVLERSYIPLWRPAHGAIIPEIMPFADRVVQETFLGLPPEEKGAEAIFRECIGLLWPEALDFPINSYGDYRDVAAKVRKAMQPRRVVNFVRKKLTEARA